jgi:hypothetical protein
MLPENRERRSLMKRAKRNNGENAIIITRNDIFVKRDDGRLLRTSTGDGASMPGRIAVAISIPRLKGRGNRDIQ